MRSEPNFTPRKTDDRGSGLNCCLSDKWLSFSWFNRISTLAYYFMSNPSLWKDNNGTIELMPGGIR